MNMMQVGLGMIIVLVAVAASVAIGMFFYLMTMETIKAYINRNVSMMIAMTIVWSFVIEVAFVLVGSV